MVKEVPHRQRLLKESTLYNKTHFQGQSSTRKVKVLVVLVIMTTVVATTAIVVLALAKTQVVGGIPFYENTKNANLVGALVNTNRLCLTPGCVIAAAQVLKKMDTSIDPCDNFYKFACGNFINKSSVPEDKNELTVFSIIGDKLDDQLKRIFKEPSDDNELDVFKKVKTFYNNCMDKDTIEKKGLGVVQKRITEFGGWPVLLGENWAGDDFDWKELMYSYRTYGYSTSQFLIVDVEIDVKNNSRRIVYIEPPNFGLQRDFLTLGRDDKVVNAYYDYMVDLAVLFGATKENAQREMSDVVDFEIYLSNHTLSSTQKRNITRLYNKFLLSEIESQFPSIPWKEYINKIMNTTLKIDSDEIVVMTEPVYFKVLEDYLCKTPKRTIANYLIWKLVKASVRTLPDSARNIALKFQRVIHGNQELQSRWRKCASDVKSMLSNAVGALYVRKYFNQASKTEIVNILKYIRAEFDQILRDNDWMDATTKQKALEKSAEMKEHIAYPDELLNDELLTEFYKEIDVVPGEYHSSYFNIVRFQANFAYGRLREPVNKTEWISHGQTAIVNAFYNHIENAIIFPAGILQGHFFDLDRPRYLNFGAFGSVIGHEITHGFDDVGRQFDKEGNLNEWWEPETRTSFLEKANCMIDQYNSYTVPEVNMKINGKNTLGENIADNGGIKESYFAYQSWQKQNPPEYLLPGLNYTANQLYWISAAQTWCSKVTPQSLRYKILVDNHSPKEYRVIVSFSNLKDFAKDFSCPSGSFMNPQKKCHVW